MGLKEYPQPVGFPFTSYLHNSWIKSRLCQWKDQMYLEIHFHIPSLMHVSYFRETPSRARSSFKFHSSRRIFFPRIFLSSKHFFVSIYIVFKSMQHGCTTVSLWNKLWAPREVKVKKMDSYGAKYQVASNKIQFRHTYAASYFHEPQSKPYPVAPRPLHPRFTNLVQLIPGRKRARRERLVFKSRIVRSLVFKRGPWAI